MSAEEPLEDDPVITEPPAYSAAEQLGFALMFVVFGVGMSVGLYFLSQAVGDSAGVSLVVALVTAVTTAVMGVIVLLTMRNGRIYRAMNSVGRGEYRGPWWLGATLEQKALDRRRRILAERKSRRESPER